MSFSARGSILLDVAQARKNLALLSGDLRNLGNTSQSGFNSVSQSIVQNEQHFTALGGTITTAGVALTGFFGVGLKQASDFQKEMNRVAALSNATAEQLKMLEQRAIEQGARTVYSAKEAADAMAFLAMAGFDVQQIYDALPGTLDLAAAAQMDLGRAADLSTNILTAFGMEASELGGVVDMLVMTFTNSNTSMEQLGDAFKYVGPVAMAAGLSFEEVAAMLGMLGDAGIQASMGGTTLRGAITRLINPTGKVKSLLDEMGISIVDANGQMLPMVDILKQFPPVTADSAQAMLQLQAAADAAGVSLEDAEGNARPLEEVFAEMEAAGIDVSSMMEGLGADAETVGQIMEIFGLRAGPGMVALLTQGTDKLEEFTAQIADSGGTAQRVADRQLEGLAGAVERLSGEWETFVIRAMNSGPMQVITGLVNVVEMFVAVLNKLPSPISGAIFGIMGLAGVVALLSGGLLLMLPHLARSYQAVMMFQKWGGASRAVTLLTGRLGLLANQMMMMPGPAGRVSTAIANMFATMRADGALKTLRGGLMNFVRMHPALVGMGLVAGAIGLAYKTNFLGIGDAVDTAIGKLRTIGEAMRAAFGSAGDEAAIAADQVAAFAEATHVVDGVTVYTAFRTNAEGVKESVGEIVESYANADGTTAQVLIKGDDGEYWATIDLATGEISNAEIKVEANTAPLHERINASLDVLRNAFEGAGMGWAADIVGNLQGVVTFVAGMATRIQGVFSGLGNVMKSLGLDRFSGMLSSMATSMGTAVIVLAPLIIGLKLLAGVVLAVLSPAVLIVAAIAALAAGVVYAYKNFEPFRKVIDRVGKALNSFARNQAAKFLKDLGRWLADAASAVGDFLKGVNDVVRPLNLLRSAASSVGGFLVSAFNAARDSGSRFRQIIQPIIGHFQNLIDMVQAFGSVIAAVFRGDWSGAWDAFQDAARATLDFIISAFTALPKTVINAFQAVDWTAVWDGLRSGVTSAIGWVLDAIRGIDWGALIQGGWNAISGGISAAWDAITSLNWRDFIPDFGAWGDWITGKLASAADWGIGAFGSWTRWIGHKLGDLAAWGITAFGGWGTYITKKLASFRDWGISSFLGWGTFITGKLSDFASWGIEVFSGWGTWIKEIVWPDWLSEFADWLVGNMPTIDWPSPGEMLQAFKDWLSGFTPFGGGPSQEDQQKAAGQTAQAGRNAGGGAQGGNWSLPNTVNLNMPEFGGSGDPRVIMSDLLAGLDGAASDNREIWRQIVDDSHAGALQSRTEATGEFAGMGREIPPHTANIRNRVQGDFRALQGALATTTAATRSNTASNFATMQSAATTSASSLRSRVIGDFSSMQRSVATSASGTRSTTSSEMSSMNTAVIGHVSGMQSRSAVQMALMASTAKSQGSATNTGMTGWISGAVARLGAGMVLMVNTIRSIGGQMHAAGLYAGDMAGRGVGDGLMRQLGYVRNAAAAIIREVDATMRKVGEMRSPSRLTTYVGEMLGQGPVVGMLSKLRDVRDASRLLMEAAIPDPYGSSWDFAMLGSPVGSGRSGGYGTTVVHNHNHYQDVKILSSADWEAYKQKSDRGNQAYNHLTDPDANNYGGGM